MSAGSNSFAGTLDPSLVAAARSRMLPACGSDQPHASCMRLRPEFMGHYAPLFKSGSVIVLERPQSKLLGTVTAMTAFRSLAVDTLRTARIQPDRP